MEQSYSEHFNNISENTTTIGLVNGKYYKKKRLVVNLYYRVLQEKNACSKLYYKKKNQGKALLLIHDTPCICLGYILNVCL